MALGVFTHSDQQKKVGEWGTTDRFSGQFKNAALKRRGACTAQIVFVTQHPAVAFKVGML